MKILVISHNVFCESDNMGKTLASYFEGIETENIAQFYIHSQVPTSHICENYFRITDKEAIKSIFTRKCGQALGKENIEADRADSRTDEGATAAIYQKARKRTPLIYLARNLIWKLSGWKNKKLLNWVDEFNPDVIFFASGDYSFMYKIALKIAEYKKIPLFLNCMDDYYLHNKNEGAFLGKFSHSLFMKQVKKTMKYSSAIFTICDKMSEDYGKAFNKKCFTLHTPTSFNEPLSHPKSNKISYIGNLGCDRHIQIVDMGRELKNLNISGAPECLDVYSAEIRPEILKYLTKENGINFCGKISSEEVKRVMGESLAVIHTESFNENFVNRVRYSVSTKIADSLMSGTPILAYGPGDVASVEYLKDNNAAFIAVSKDELPKTISLLVQNENERQEIVKKAIDLAKTNHNGQKNAKMILDVMGEYV